MKSYDPVPNGQLQSILVSLVLPSQSQELRISKIDIRSLLTHHCLESTYSRRVLPLFFATRTEAPHGEVLGFINPLSNSPCNWTLSSCNSTGAILCGVIEMVEVPGCNSIPKSTSLCGGSPSSSSGKKKKNPHILNYSR